MSFGDKFIKKNIYSLEEKNRSTPCSDPQNSIKYLFRSTGLGARGRAILFLGYTGFCLGDDGKMLSATWASSWTWL